MKTFQFSVNSDKRLACSAETELDAWKWLAATKSLSIEKVKKLYKIKLK
jgi:hypothetical protein|tara:strand:- start:332 stop:478 length:147 start_codon:yes stop_codon:yes gene_type:complete